MFTVEHDLIDMPDVPAIVFDDHIPFLVCELRECVNYFLGLQCVT